MKHGKHSNKDWCEQRVGSLFRTETSAFFIMQLSEKTPDPFIQPVVKSAWWDDPNRLHFGTANRAFHCL